MVAAPVGLMAGFLTNVYFEENGGMDLSQYAGALEQYGGDAIFYPADRTINLLIVDVGRYDDRFDRCDLSSDQSRQFKTFRSDQKIIIR